MEPILRHPLLDELFDAGRELLGDDLRAYRNHAYRVLNYTRAHGAEATDAVAVAVYFHDIGIWTDRTLDYLEPSANRAKAYLEARGEGHETDAVGAMIRLHHKVRPAGKPGAPVEAFRRADWTDVTRGALRFGLPIALVREVEQAFPNSGFHARLTRLFLHRLRTAPLRPLPMLRW